MTRRLPVASSPGPLEDYALRFDDLLRARAQREGFRRYLEGLLLPAERNKTLTALANTEPVAGTQRKEAQRLQWFLSESGWDQQELNGRRLELLFEDSATAPNGEGVLIIDEHGDRKWGKHTAHVGKQWLAYPWARPKTGWLASVVCGRTKGCTTLWRSSPTRPSTTSRVALPIRASAPN
jgi:SRSO17 transposase